MKQTKKGKRAYGRGTIVVKSDGLTPYYAKVPDGTKIDKNGKLQTVYKYIGHYSTRTQAEDALYEYNKNPTQFVKSKMTFKQLYEEWSEKYYHHISPSSVRTVKCAYEYCNDLYDMQISEIGPGHIKDAMEFGYVIRNKGREAGVKVYASECTQERMKSLCNLMFDYAVERNMLSENPARKFDISNLLQSIDKHTKVKKPFSVSQVKELWKYVGVVPFADMVLIGIYTGFRPQELASLELKNIYLDDDKIIGGMKTEAGTNREVPIHPEIRPLIENRCIEAKKIFHSKTLFNDMHAQQGTAMTYDKYRHRFDFVMRSLDFEGYSPHCTRHTFATQAMRCGMDPGIRKRILGHSLKGDITESVYTHPSWDDMTEEIKKLHF